MYFFAGLELLRNTLGWIIQSKTSIGIQLLHFFFASFVSKKFEACSTSLDSYPKDLYIDQDISQWDHHSDGEENMKK